MRGYRLARSRCPVIALSGYVCWGTNGTDDSRLSLSNRPYAWGKSGQSELWDDPVSWVERVFH